MKKNIIFGLIIIGIILILIAAKNKDEQEIAPAVDDQAALVYSDTSGQNPGEVNVETAETIQKMTSAILHTSQGDIEIEFFDTATPKTVENFTKLARDGFYDGVKFHRVIKGFMIQGGDPLSKDDSKINIWGTGGPGYTFADEIGGTNANNSNVVGTISMANAGANTNGSQFFINTAANNFLDSKHTVFGKIISGMDVVTKIENSPTSAEDRPITPVVIKSISLK